MKTKTIIEELTREDLVDLLCTATYGSSWLGCSAPLRKGVNVDECESREELWADALLAGNDIKFYDFYAEGVVYDNNNLVCGIEDEEGTAYYWVSLVNIIEGLSRCANGTFKSDSNDRDYISKCFESFKEGEGDMDNIVAENLMQIILFDELIYG